MSRRGLLIWLAVVVTVTAAAPAGVCSQDGDFDLRARLSIRKMRFDDESIPPPTGGAPAPVGEKSVARAMLLSALLPGLGEIYAGGRRGLVTGAGLAALDAFSWWQYFDNNGKGDDEKDSYERFAAVHYSRDRFYGYVADTIAVFSGSDDLGFCQPGAIYDSVECRAQIDRVFPLSPENGGTFHEQIDVDDRYIFGWLDWNQDPPRDQADLWVDWDPYSAIPEDIPTSSANRKIYRGMRDKSDDYYGKADTYAWIMVINRVVSMIDAAIMVKLRNRDLAALGDNPRLTFKAKLRGKPSFRVGVKVRF
jgi:hypothetical protein